MCVCACVYACVCVCVCVCVFVYCTSFMSIKVQILTLLDVNIVLRVPCAVTEVQLTVKNGISSSEFASTLSIWVCA